VAGYPTIDGRKGLTDSFWGNGYLKINSDGGNGAILYERKEWIILMDVFLFNSIKERGTRVTINYKTDKLGILIKNEE